MNVVTSGCGGKNCGIEITNSKEAKKARQKWGQCVTEFGEMVSEEVRTNTRYHGIQK